MEKMSQVMWFIDDNAKPGSYVSDGNDQCRGVSGYLNIESTAFGAGN